MRAFVTQTLGSSAASTTGPVMATSASRPNVAKAQNVAAPRFVRQARRQTSASTPNAAMLTYWSALARDSTAASARRSPGQKLAAHRKCSGHGRGRRRRRYAQMKDLQQFEDLNSGFVQELFA